MSIAAIDYEWSRKNVRFWKQEEASAKSLSLREARHTDSDPVFETLVDEFLLAQASPATTFP